MSNKNSYDGAINSPEEPLGVEYGEASSFFTLQTLNICHYALRIQ